MQSLRMALNPRLNPSQPNFGFLRRDAALAIVIISDEGDCSTEPSFGTPCPSARFQA